MDTDSKPLFAFGYGLSYSEFEYSKLEIEKKNCDELRNGEKIKVKLDVKNVSDIYGKAVVQLYLTRFSGTVTHRIMELCGFDKVGLNPNESRTVSFEIGFDELKEWSVNKKYELFEMDVDIKVGKASDNIILSEKIHID